MLFALPTSTIILNKTNIPEVVFFHHNNRGFVLNNICKKCAFSLVFKPADPIIYGYVQVYIKTADLLKFSHINISGV